MGDKNGPEFWKEISWRAAAEAVPQIAKRSDAVIVHEGQDFAMEDWLLVEALSRGSRLWAFGDPAQAFWSERPIRADLFQARFKLKKPYRCPEAVRILSETYIGGPSDDRRLREAMSSGIIKIVSCPNANAVRRKIATELDRLLSEGLTPADVAILSLRGNAPKESVAHLDKLGTHPLVRAYDDSIDSNVIVETFLRFKGWSGP